MKNYLTPETYLEQQLKEEEFRYWDATRNGCSQRTLESMEQKINVLKAQLAAHSMSNVLEYIR